MHRKFSKKQLTQIQKKAYPVPPQPLLLLLLNIIYLLDKAELSNREQRIRKIKTTKAKNN